MEKQKKTLDEVLDETRTAVSDYTAWCIIIALHQEMGKGSVQLNRMLARENELVNENTRAMVELGTRQADAIREAWLPEGVPAEFRVPQLRAPKNRREQQILMAGCQAGTIAWQLLAKACMDTLGFGPVRLRRLHGLAWKNYEQLNREMREDPDWAMDRLRRCAEAAMREPLRVEDSSGKELYKEDEREAQKAIGTAQRMQDKLQRSAIRAEVRRQLQPDLAGKAPEEMGAIFARCMAETLRGGARR